MKKITGMLAACAIFSSLAHAGGGGGLSGGATEVTQIMNNAELVTIGIEEQLQTIEQIEQTYLGRLQQLRATLGEYTAPFQRAYGTYQKIVNLQSKLTSMQGKVENLKSNLDGRFLEFSASNLSWNDWMQREARAVSYGDQRARAKLETNRVALEEVNESMQSYKQAASGMENTPGVHAAVQQLAPMLQTLGSDVNRLITVTSQANIDQGEERIQQVAKDKAAAIDMRARLIEAQNARQKTKEVFDDMEARAKSNLGIK